MQNEFLWLLWIFAAAIVAGAFTEARASHRVRRRRAWVRRQIWRGERQVARELDATRAELSAWRRTDPGERS